MAPRSLQTAWIKDYAFNWSYGIGETFTLIVPRLYGGSNGGKENEQRLQQVCRKNCRK